MTRSFPPRSVSACSSDSNRLSPLHFTKAHRRSTLSAVAISDRISLIRDGSPLAFVSKAASFKGVCGRVSKRRRLFTLRFGSTAVNSVGGLTGVSSTCFKSSIIWRTTFERFSDDSIASSFRATTLPTCLAKRSGTSTSSIACSSISTSSACLSSASASPSVRRT